MFVEHRLPNGLQVVCEQMPQVTSAALAFYVKTGSRHEHPHERGVSHFLEHMCFKGSRSRTWYDINVRFDELGSLYNAFTSKEQTVYYGWLPAKNTAPQLELLADLLRPVLPPDEFEVERKVILEEIAMSGDSFDHQVFDFLHRVCFADHPLAHEILGEHDQIANLPRETMQAYLEERYGARNVVLVAAGAVEPQTLFVDAGRLCGPWQPGGNGRAFPDPPPLPTGVHKKQLPSFKQQSVVLLYPAPAPGGPWDETLEVFAALFGGSNSRCYWNIVQKGIATQAGAIWLNYNGYGMLAFYADGEPQQAERMLAALRHEIKHVSVDGFSATEVDRVKNRLRTQLAAESESPRTRLMQIIDDLDTLGAVRTAEARLAALRAVTPARLKRLLDTHPITGDGLLLSVGPRDWPDV